MNPTLSLVQRHELRLSGGTTESVFPKVEQWLQQDSDHQHALRHIAGRKSVIRYRSVIDFIFTELHPSMHKHVVAFYEDRGPQIRFMITERERVYFEARMIVLLEVAYGAFCAHRAMSWQTAVAMVDLVAA